LNASFHPAHDCFALLDDCDASADDPPSRLLTGWVETLACDDGDGLPAMLARMEESLRQGLHAVGLFSYELGADMHRIAPRSKQEPLAQVLLFKHCERLSSAQVLAWLAARKQDRPAGIAQVRASVTDGQFEDAISRIHTYIEAGDTYQINYTYRLRFDAFGSPVDLYRRLRERQPVPYGALIMLPDGCAVLSLSPELFVRHAQGLVTTRPMKGTSAASGDAAIDSERSAALAADPKNRAENLMIVDLLRNDLGRVAKFGSVRVPKLFSVDRYSSVLQMTSTVEAELQAGIGLSDVFDALYPCGSITGAPKRRTMQIIRELEPDPRGIYTGAIGWFDAPAAGRRIGDFCLSVPIRTLTLQPETGDGIRKGELGVGAGIVHDSVAREELAECRLKASFLTGLPNAFELFETIHATRKGGCRNIDLHLQRLRASAGYFGFSFDEVALRAALKQACSALVDDSPYRVRLALKQDGTCSIQSAPLAPIESPVKILIAAQRTDANDLFLRHKTTVRERYDDAWRAAEAQGAFDMLFCNERSEVTEGGRSNIFVKIAGRWTTPPLASGVLPGVMRSVVLADPQWNATEGIITLDDIRHAEEVIACNALRGALPATVDWSQASFGMG
jgi:para-aminobenzoate synthetase / 4-amino-4-deoxychorismate lyase